MGTAHYSVTLERRIGGNSCDEMTVGYDIVKARGKPGRVALHERGAVESSAYAYRPPPTRGVPGPSLSTAPPTPALYLYSPNFPVIITTTCNDG